MAIYWENSCSFGLRYVSWYKYLIVSLVFSHLGFWSGNLFLIAPFPDLCLLVPLYLFKNINSLKRNINGLREVEILKMTGTFHKKRNRRKEKKMKLFGFWRSKRLHSSGQSLALA